MHHYQLSRIYCAVERLRDGVPHELRLAVRLAGLPLVGLPRCLLGGSAIDMVRAWMYGGVRSFPLSS